LVALKFDTFVFGLNKVCKDIKLKTSTKSFRTLHVL